MAGGEAVVQENHNPDSKDDSEDLEKVLGVVVKRRKTFPAKCMELIKRKGHFELLRLENANVVTEENTNQEEFRKIIQDFKNQKSFQFTLDDLNEVKQMLEKYQRRNEEVNKYLEKRKMYKYNQ